MTPPKHSLLEGDVAPHLRRLSIPLAFGMMSMTLFSLADTYFISQLGTRPLAALAFTLPVVLFFMGVTFGLSVGTAAVLARVYGEGDFDRVRQMSTDALVMAAIVSAAAALVGLATIEVFFPLMGAGEDVMPLIRRYMTVWYMGLPFFGVMVVGNSCMRARKTNPHARASPEAAKTAEKASRSRAVPASAASFATSPNSLAPSAAANTAPSAATMMAAPSARKKFAPPVAVPIW
jgi:hypothetical protein